MKHTVADYDIGERVGSGRLGELYVARQRSLDRRVLLRIVRPELTEDPSSLDQLEGELQRLGGIRHPDLVQILDRSGRGQGFFYTLEWFDAVDLSTLTSQGFDAPDEPGEVRYENRLRALIDLLQSFVTFQRQGIVLDHVRPSEILVVPPFRFLLSEPGLAGSVEGRRDGSSSEYRELLRSLLSLVLDPAWDPVKADSDSNLESALGQSSFRQEVFAGLFDASSTSDVEASLQAIRLLESRLGHVSSQHAEEPRMALTQETGSATRRVRVHRDFSFVTVVSLMIVAAGTLWALRLSGDARRARQGEVRSQLELALTARDRAGVLSLLSDSDAVEPELRRVAVARLDDWRAEAVDDALQAEIQAIVEGKERPLPESTDEPDEHRTHLEVLFNPAHDETDRRYQALDRLIANRGHLPEGRLRTVQLALLDDKDSVMRRRAAAMFASPVLGTHPPHVDKALEQRLRAPDVDPSVALGIVAYFARLAPERSESVLEELAVAPEREMYAPNPDTDPWTEQLYRSLGLTGSVLNEWTSMPVGDPRPERVRLRAAALFALSLSGSEKALARAQLLLTSPDTAIARAAAALIETCSGSFSPEQLEELYESLLESADAEVRLPMLRALGAVAADRGFDRLIAELRDPSSQGTYQLSLVDQALKAGFVLGPAELARLVDSCPVHVLPGVAEVMSSRGPPTGRWSDHVESVLQDNPDQLAPALLAGFLAIQSPEVYEVLTAAVADSQRNTSTRSLALRSLAACGGDRALLAILDLVEREEESVAVRLAAIDQSRSFIGVPAFDPDLRRYRYVVPEVNKKAQSVLSSLVRVVRQDDPFLSRVVATILSYYESSRVRNAFVDLLEPELDEDLLEIVAEFFSRDVPVEFQAALDVRYSDDDERPRVIALLSEDVAPHIKAKLIAHLVAHEDRSAVDVILEEAPLLYEPEAELQALRYLERFLAPEEASPENVEGVEDAMLTLLEYGSSSAVVKAALTSLEISRSDAAAPYFALIVEDQASYDTEIVFQAARAALGRGEPFDSAALLESVRRYLEDLASLSSTTTRLELTRIAELVKSHSDADFTDEMVDWLSEYDRPEDTPIPLGLLILRLAELGHGPEPVHRVLAETGFTLSDLIGEMEQSLGLHLVSRSTSTTLGLSYSSRSSGPVLTRGVFDYLCEGFPDEPSPFRLRGRALRLGPSLALSGGRFEPDYLGKRLTQAAEDLQMACLKGDPAADQLQLELAAVLVKNGDPHLGISVLRDHLRIRPDDTAARAALAAILVEASWASLEPNPAYLEEARQHLARVRGEGTTPAQLVTLYGYMVGIRLQEGDEETLIALVSEVRADPELAKDVRSQFEVLAGVLRHCYDRRDDADVLRNLRAQLIEMFRHALRYDFGWLARREAAYHLGWLGDEEVVDELIAAAKTDLAPGVRTECLLALHSTAPDAANQLAGQLLGDGAGEVRAAALWVLSKSSPERTAGVLANWSHPRSDLLGLALPLLPRFGDAQCVENLQACMHARIHARIRASAASLLGVVGNRGHPVELDRLRSSRIEDVNEGVQRAAHRSLARLGDAQVLKAARGAVGDALATAESNATLAFREDAVSLLAYDDSSEARKLLERVVDLVTRRYRGVLTEGLEFRESEAARLQDDEEWGDIGDDHARLGNLAAALVAYEEALRLDPTDFEWIEKVGSLRSGLNPVTTGVTGAGFGSGLTASLALESFSRDRRQLIENVLRRHRLALPPDVRSKLSGDDERDRMGWLLQVSESGDTPSLLGVGALLLASLDPGHLSQLEGVDVFARRLSTAFDLLVGSPYLETLAGAFDDRPGSARVGWRPYASLDYTDYFYGDVPTDVEHARQLAEVLSELARVLIGGAETPLSGFELRRVPFDERLSAVSAWISELPTD